jgi:hypothetical protein
MGGVLVLILIAFASAQLLSRLPTPSHKYYNSVIGAENRFGTPWPDQALLQRQEYDLYAEQWTALARAHKALANQLRAIPARDVDTELVQNALRTAEFLDKQGEHDLEGAHIARAAKECIDNHESTAALISSFLRGVAGESPLNGYNEARSEYDQVEQMHRDWLSEGKELDEQHAALESERTHIKIRLSKQDQVDY